MEPAASTSQEGSVSPKRLKLSPRALALRLNNSIGEELAGWNLDWLAEVSS